MWQLTAHSGTIERIQHSSWEPSLPAPSTATHAQKKNPKVFFLNAAWQIVLIIVLNTEYVVFDVPLNRSSTNTPPCAKKISGFIHANYKARCSSSSFASHSLFSARFRLSLRAAAMCSKDSYRVKITDGLDFRDSVCVFWQCFMSP